MALLELLDPDKLPEHGGEATTVMVTISLDQIRRDLAVAGLLDPTGTTDEVDLSASQARRMACNAHIIPVVLGGKSEVLDLGRSRRLFTRKLRRAITARDGGCTAPGCTIPAPWCEAHHIEPWEHGGPTSTDNGVLLCNHHHHSVHAGAWEIDMRSGRPWFIPAPYLDPRQRPQRNRYWRQ